jgi:hypothetical protein
MTDNLAGIRDDNGQLPTWAWPGGYPMYYVTADGMTVCPDCANREVDQSQRPIAGDANWEDPELYCDDCGKRIESAYAEEE